jgi:hypothetical protein
MLSRIHSNQNKNFETTIGVENIINAESQFMDSTNDDIVVSMEEEIVSGEKAVNTNAQKS